MHSQGVGILFYKPKIMFLGFLLCNQYKIKTFVYAINIFVSFVTYFKNDRYRHDLQQNNQHMLEGHHCLETILFEVLNLMKSCDKVFALTIFS